MEAEEIRLRLAATQSTGRVRADIGKALLCVLPLVALFVSDSWRRQDARAAGVTALWCLAPMLALAGYHWYRRTHPTAMAMSAEQLNRVAAAASACGKCGEPILRGEIKCIQCGGSRSPWELSITRVAIALGLLGVVALVASGLSRMLS